MNGYNVNEISAQLNLSPKTVANHLSLARAKLDVDCDIALFRLAVAAGVVTLKTPLVSRDTPP